jgi:hypothetical protein
MDLGELYELATLLVEQGVQVRAVSHPASR